ncbi:MAG: hypothetical protein ACK4N5_00280 [Myxococcales bacterium]
MTRLDARPRLWPLLACAWIALETALIGVLAPRGERPALLAAALAADVVLIAAVAYWRSGERLAPQRLVRAAALGVVLFVAASRLLGLPFSGPLLPLAATLELGLAFLLARAIVRGVRGEALWTGLRTSLGAHVPPGAAAWLVSELRIVHAFVGWALRRPVPVPAPSATVYLPMRASRSAWVVPFVAIASVVELLAAHALLLHFAPGHPWAHVLVAALHGYTLMWLVGDRRLLLASSHRLEDAALVLELGLRFEARVPWSRVRRVLRLRDDRDRKAVQPKDGSRNPAATPPLDPPNVHLCFSGRVEARGLFGLPKTIEHLDLFVERPEEFVAELERRLGH